MWGDDEGGKVVWDGRVGRGGVYGVYGCESERGAAGEEEGLTSHEGYG